MRCERANEHSKRHGEILRLLQEEGTITIARLAERLERFAGDGAARREAAHQRRLGAEDARRDRPAVFRRRGAVRTAHARECRRQARHRQARRRHHRRRRIRHARHRHDDQLPRPRAAQPPPPDRGDQLVRHRPHARHRERQQGLHGGRRVAQRFRRCLRCLGDRVRQPLQRQPRRHLRRRHQCRARRHGLCAGGGGVRPRGADARHPHRRRHRPHQVRPARASSRSAASTASANSRPTFRRRATSPPRSRRPAPSCSSRARARRRRATGGRRRLPWLHRRPRMARWAQDGQCRRRRRRPAL